MNYRIKHVIDIDEWHHAAELQYGIKMPSFRRLFFKGCANDCYKDIWWDDGYLEDLREERDNGDEDANLKLLALSILQDTFPDTDNCIVDVTW